MAAGPLLQAGLGWAGGSAPFPVAAPSGLRWLCRVLLNAGSVCASCVVGGVVASLAGRSYGRSHVCGVLHLGLAGCLESRLYNVVMRKVAVSVRVRLGSRR